ncbi:uncharacterized protein SCHCODRAFT_02637779 [Schizophyllum commune H4-8]|uniref:uncharacterized protein n=1 Tax=Schizophyllum commune (strain H4-8 / FGSC 9210) TaxID=578458 RepID=UPI00215FD18C|nr:uncharacterized protein SCHCODRAFT_02637779 [Schizophyllum commune H4-8]KAI5888805.1 hypothetical protein SCHCODRAFT_02637779 [Schizophyllum commune H4-8]
MSAKDSEPAVDPGAVHDEEAPGPAISVPESNDTGEGGKLKMIMQLVKKCFGVKDIAAMRLSLPASLLEPIPNLEYWHYLDRPDVFASINDSEDPFERMLAVVKFTFTKDLKFVHGKICKPYNSVLGEHFRAHWDVVPAANDFVTSSARAADQASLAPETASIRSGKSSKSTRSGLSLLSKPGKSPSTAPTSVEAQMSDLSLEEQRTRIVFLTEQVSHHPPVSSYYAACPDRHIEMYGTDQISAKVSGTTVRVLPGQHNKGIYIKLTGGPGAGEEYRITHPSASVNGVLRGNFYATMTESTIITCDGAKPGLPKFRTIIEYKEESWLGRPHFLVEGVIHTVHDGDEPWTKVKAVPHNRVVAIFDGSWRGKIRWRRVGAGSFTVPASASASRTSLAPSVTAGGKSAMSSVADFSKSDNSEYEDLIDLAALQILPKSVRPLEEMDEYESRKLWGKVTEHLTNKEYSEATREKIEIEQRQRDLASERKKKGEEFVPKYFDKDISTGYATLTDAGKKVVEEIMKDAPGKDAKPSEQAKEDDKEGKDPAPEDTPEAAKAPLPA